MPLLSIIIPTRNRSKYLSDAIQVISENIQDVEVIVADNSDTDELRSVLSSYIKANRIKYIYSNENLTVVDNFELAFAAASGEYLISIGDDDSIGPGLEEIAIWAKTNNVDAVISYSSSFLASYYWPGVQSKYFGNAYEARLFVNEFSGKIRPIDTAKALRDVGKQLGGGLGELPRVYHGLVSREVIDKIKSTHQKLFGGASPDIYSAALIAGYCKNPVIIDFPFIIPGASPASTAGQGAARTDRGSISETEHTARFGKRLIWDHRIPEFYSPQTIWAYSFCQAIDLMPQHNVQPSFGRLYVRCFLYTRGYTKKIFIAIRTQAKRVGYFRLVGDVLQNLAYELLDFFSKVSARILYPRAGGRAMVLGSYKNISAAYVSLNDYILKNKIEIKFEDRNNNRIKNK